MKKLYQYILGEGLLDDLDDLEQDSDNNVNDLFLSNSYKVYKVTVYDSNKIAKHIPIKILKKFDSKINYKIEEIFDDYVDDVNPIRAKKIAVIVNYLMGIPIADDLLKKDKYDIYREVDLSELVNTKVYLYLDDYDKTTKDVCIQLRIGEGNIKILLEKK